MTTKEETRNLIRQALTDSPILKYTELWNVVKAKGASYGTFNAVLKEMTPEEGTKELLRQDTDGKVYYALPKNWKALAALTKIDPADEFVINQANRLVETVTNWQNDLSAKALKNHEDQEWKLERKCRELFQVARGVEKRRQTRFWRPWTPTGDIRPEEVEDWYETFDPGLGDFPSDRPPSTYDIVGSTSTRVKTNNFKGRYVKEPDAPTLYDWCLFFTRMIITLES
jgi:hypothetical protein